jgi:hypothetical protein
MKKILILAALLMFPSLMFPSQAQAITDVPGCGEYVYSWSYSAVGTWNPTYATWCGSDEWGWYNVGALFSKYTRPGSEVPRSVERGGSHGRTVSDIEARLLGYFSEAASVMQVGHTLERFK